MAGIAHDLSARLRLHGRRLRALARTAPAGSYRNPQHPPSGDEPGRLPAGCGLLRPCTGRHGACRCNPRPPALRAGNQELRPRSCAACRRTLAAPSPRVAAQRVGARGAERTSWLPACRLGAGLRPPRHNRPRCAIAYSARLCRGSPRPSPAARGAALDAGPRFRGPWKTTSRSRSFTRLALRKSSIWLLKLMQLMPFPFSPHLRKSRHLINCALAQGWQRNWPSNGRPVPGTCAWAWTCWGAGTRLAARTAGNL